MIATLLLLAAAATADRPVESPSEVPQELRAFVPEDARAIWLSEADLDRDGDGDFILVLERPPTSADEDMVPGQRPLLVLLRGTDGKLREAKRNERLVMCPRCGGVMGDPFAGIVAGTGTFTVQHYGGSSWRWSSGFRFDYSRRDATWQLVLVEESSFHASDPGTEKITKATPPKDFGKIDLADFDPEDWKGRGEK